MEFDKEFLDKLFEQAYGESTFASELRPTHFTC